MRLFILSAAVFLLLLVAHSPAALALQPGLETVLVPPPEPVKAGETVRFALYFHNTGGGRVVVRPPERALCRLDTENGSFEVAADAVQTDAGAARGLEPGAFWKTPYDLAVPTAVNGHVRMTVDGVGAAPARFLTDVSERTGEAGGAAADTSPARRPYESLDTLFSLYQPYAGNIGAYEPMYFLVGADPEDSKFQISLKYRFFNEESPLAQAYPWLRGIHAAYTQTSFWDLASDSAPFEDTSYKPEVFYLSHNLASRPAWMKGLFLQGGYQHESNGRGGVFSRSTNHLYVKPIVILFDEGSRLGVQIAPKVWTYVANEDENNPDLSDYRGYFDLDLKFGKADSFVLGANLRWADEGPSVLLDLTYPLDVLFFKNFDLYLHLQYVNALAESLIDYRQRSEAFRMGFSIVR
jgi:outer membrane phospholipase A